MVFGSLLIVLLLTSGCATNDRYAYSAHNVQRSDKDKHEQCVYFALTDMELGEQCNWYTRTSNGTAQVMSYYPAGSGYCATIFNTVWNNGRSKHWQETACKTGSSNQWRFLKN